MVNAYIYDGVRSPFGRLAGSLASTRPDDLLAHVIKTLIQRNPFELSDYEDVIIGNTNQAGEDSRNIARFSGLLSGLPLSVGGITLNRLCGSSLAAALDAARCIRCGEGELFVAGGVEMMSRAPLVISKATSAFARDQQIADTTMGARFSNQKIIDGWGNDTMPQTADNIAQRLNITREQCDEFAAQSQEKYQHSLKQGFITREIVGIEVSHGRRQPKVLIDQDEHPRPSSTLEALGTLRPLFDDGVVTAGNASGMNDGASALLIGSAEIGQRYGIKPRAKIIGGAIAGVEPKVMGLGPVPAITKALARAGLSLDDMDVIEINEAFASQVLGCLAQLGIAFDDKRVNPNGGAIAVGHPLGASGSRILLSAIHQLERSNGRYAVVSMCIGIGQGIAIIIERVEQ